MELQGSLPYLKEVVITPYPELFLSIHLLAPCFFKVCVIVSFQANFIIKIIMLTFSKLIFIPTVIRSWAGSWISNQMMYVRTATKIGVYLLTETSHHLQFASCWANQFSCSVGTVSVVWRVYMFPRCILQLSEILQHNLTHPVWGSCDIMQFKHGGTLT
jgi:hypothetical protein